MVRREDLWKKSFYLFFVKKIIYLGLIVIFVVIVLNSKLWVF